MNDVATDIEPKRSTWRNPSAKHVARITLLVANEQGGNREHVVEIQPGATMKILSLYDDAIVSLHNGAVEGGLCPWLQRLDPPEPPGGWRRGSLFAVPDQLTPVASTTNNRRVRRTIED
jgi:hypothetical protein